MSVSSRTASLPIVGKRFVTSGSAVESRIGALLGVLRPMWELATGLVPTMTDGNVGKAKDIIQTNAWSQAAKYRDKDAGKAMCVIPTPFSEAQGSGRRAVIHALLTAVGISETKYNLAHIYNCNDFLPDPPYEAGTLVGVPWVLADAKDPKREADDRLPLGDNNYLKQIAQASIQVPDAARPLLTAYQSGPALLQALVSYSVQMEQGDAVERFVIPIATVDGVTTMRTPSMPFVEAHDDNEAMFTIETPGSWRPSRFHQSPAPPRSASMCRAAVSVPIVSSPAVAHKAATELDLSVHHLLPGDERSWRRQGEPRLPVGPHRRRAQYRVPNHTRRVLLSSRRLDQRARNRRLEQMRGHRGGGNLCGRRRVGRASQGRPPPRQRRPPAGTVARSGGHGRHPPQQVHREPRDWRLRHQARLGTHATRDRYPAGPDPRSAAGRALRVPDRARAPRRAARAIHLAAAPRLPVATGWPAAIRRVARGGRRPDVVDGVAVLAAREQQPPTVRDRLQDALDHLEQAPAPISNDDWNKVAAVIDMAAALADGVTDLLIAEGTHQILQGNLERAAAAMAIVDKRVAADRNGIQHHRARRRRVRATARRLLSRRRRNLAKRRSLAGRARRQRVARVDAGRSGTVPFRHRCPPRYRRQRPSHRGRDPSDRVTVRSRAFTTVGGVALSGAVGAAHLLARETGFRRAIVDAFIAALVNPATVTGLDIALESDAATRLGLGHFEAIAATLKAVIDKARPAARFDLVKVDDTLEPKVPTGEGQFPGVDVVEIVTRADDAENRFATLTAALAASANAASFLSALTALDVFLPSRNWPAEVFAIDAAGPLLRIATRER
mgnify:CR=1 FL=1